MLIATEKPAGWARRCALYLVLGAALVTIFAPIRDSGAAETGRAAGKAKFARPATVPFPPDNPYSAEKAELGRMLFSTP